MKYWLWLSALPGVGCVKAARLLERFEDPREIFFAREQQLAETPELTPRDVAALMNKDLRRAAGALEICRKSGFHILTLADGLYPESLRAIPAPPPVLFYCGTLPGPEGEPGIAVVGSRRASADGLLSAGRLGDELARCGMTVVTGMAAGIDTMAAKGALEAGGRVLGVLGCGLDVVYPRGSGKMYDAVAENGALISEFLPGTPPLGGNFPIRNRVISGLSLGVVVVEASEKSGALITADHAAEQGRDVFAVPGSINSETCRGSNRLLRDGAQLAECGWDVASLYQAAWPDRIRKPVSGQASGRTETNPDRAFRAPPERPARADDRPSPPAAPTREAVLEAAKGFSPVERAVLLCLLEGEKSKDEIISQTALEAPEALSALTMLEIEGAAEPRPGGRFAFAMKLQTL